MAGLDTDLGAPAIPRRWFDRGEASGWADRVPLFAEALNGVAAAWTDGFAALAATPATFTFAGIFEARVSAVMSRRGAGSVFAVVDAPGWGATVGLHIDRPFLSAVIEALFGGEADEEGEGTANGQDRPVTAVERRIAEVVAGQATEALAAGFADALPSPFAFVRVQPKPDLSFLGRPNTIALVATLRLAVLGRTAEIDILVARGALDGFADRLAVLPADEPENTDPRWSERLETQVASAPIDLSALVSLDHMTLSALSSLRVGQLIPLPSNASGDVRLVCEGRELFRCDLGQSSGFYTVRIDEPVVPAARPGA